MWPKVARRLAALALVTVARADLDNWLVRCSKDCEGRNQCDEVCSGTQKQHHHCPQEADCPATNTFCPDGAEPRPCEFSEWSAWSSPLECSGLCTRTREIRQQNSCGGAACEGPLHDSRYCDSACETAPQDCLLGPWKAWSLCGANVTQQRQRRRGVQALPARGGAQCHGALLETEDCGASASQSTDCELSSWMAWSPCTSSTCGGQRGRLRTILRHARNGGRHCADTLGETAPCNTGPCSAAEAADCVMSSWGEWSACNGAQEKRRSREVARSATGAGKACEGSVTEVLGCAAEVQLPTAVDCAVGLWSEWQLCDRSCGGGQTIRSRNIANHATAGGALCAAALQETVACNTGSCSLYHQPCRPSAWSDWGGCSCAPGSATRTRTYAEADAGGQACDLVLKETKPCAANAQEAAHCQVQDCELSEWSEWRACTKTCMGGMTERDRHVVKHASVGGKPCSDFHHLLEVKPCGEGACNVNKDCEDGAWGTWQGWSDCTKSCRGGFRLAQRRVAKEANQCGVPAQGAATKIESCNDGVPCSGSVDCELTEWSSWSACDKPCTGVRERSRGIKVHPKDGGVPCGSEEKATSLSEMEHCPAEPGTNCEIPVPDGCNFGQWDAWSECSATCDGGQTSRSRKVLPGADGSLSPCQGKTLETAPCATQSCGHKVDCEYSAWEDWGECTKCGGQRFRSRSISKKPMFGGLECQASETMQTSRCPRECGEQLYWCEWTDWSQLSDCTETCGVGVQFRKRTLSMTDKRPSDPLAVASSKKDCSGQMVDLQQCSKLPACDACKLQDCQLSEWSSWSAPLCEGICTRGRRVVASSNACGKPCEGTLKSTKPCAADCHDKDCVLGDWSGWTSCATPTDNKYRSRQILEPGAFNGKACSLSSLNETASCLTESDAPVDCSLTEWTAWTPCSRTCGKGQQSRSRSVAVQASRGGKACLGSLKSFQHCEMESCLESSLGVTNCQWKQWSEWQACEGSQQVRTREVQHAADASGDPCEGVMVETRGCGKDVSLPSNCDADVFSAWSVWTSCPKTCGGAQSSRSRIIKPHAHSGLHCSGTLLETKPCGQVSCPDSPNTVCQYSEWTGWGECTRSCGEGYKERSRSIAVAAVGGVEGCTGALVEAQKCTFAPCESGVDCAWGNWNAWSDCVPAPTECGIGYKRRNRSIATMPSGGKLCDPKPFEEVMPVSGCRGQAMCCVDGEWHDWQEWQPCTESCGSGTRKRLRVNKTQESFCGKPPPGSNVEYESCSASACEVDVDCEFSQWEPFSDCSAACHGQQTRSRRILRNSTGKGSPCVGALMQSAGCNPAEGETLPFSCGDAKIHGGSQDCVMSDWSGWSACSATCEKGYSLRERRIQVNPQKGGKSCPPAIKEMKNCNPDISCFEGRVNCVWEAWTKWSECDAFDKKTRTRGHARQAANGGLDCEGSTREVTGCSKGGAGSCTVTWYNCSWGVWDSWSDCSSTCGRGGVRHRERKLKVSDVTNIPSGHSEQIPVDAAQVQSTEILEEPLETSGIRPEEVSFGEGNDFADFKCSENVFWRDQWSSGLKQFCCESQQICEDKQAFLGSQTPQTDWVEELSSPQLPDTVVRYDLSMLKAKVLAAEAKHSQDLRAAFGLGSLCLVAGAVVSARLRSSDARYDMVPQNA